MRGHYVERKGGWDCHGLPVEITVEQELGISSKAEIEAYGIAEFNQRCRESVFTFLEDWDRLTERIGFWVDLDDAYRTLDTDYIESVWWALKQIADKDLLYEGHKVVPYCPRCGTALSSHEVAQGYKDVVDPQRLRALPGARAGRPAAGRRRAARLDDDARGRSSPTPPSPSIPTSIYVRARVPGERRAAGRRRGACRARARRGRRDPRPLPGRRDRGHRATSRRSRSCPAETYGPKGHTVLLGDFVTAEDGTGLVHTAIAFGEDDFRLGQQARPDRRQPGEARRHLRRAHRAVRRALRQGRRPRPRRGPARPRAPAARRGLRARLPALLALRRRRSSTTPSPPGTSRRRRSATGCSRPTRRSTGTPSTSRTGASATGCATTSTGRCRASATGARRCRSGAASRGTST